MRALIYVVLPKVYYNPPLRPDPASHPVACQPDIHRTWLAQRLQMFKDRSESRRFINKAEFRCIMQWLGWEPARIRTDSITEAQYGQLQRALYPDASLGRLEIQAPGVGIESSAEFFQASTGSGSPDPAEPTDGERLASKQRSDVLGSDEDEEALRQFFVALALPILLRVPLNTPDSHEKRRTAEMNVIYASQLPQTSTPFMVTLEGNGNVLFRLINSRLDELRGACDYLVASLKRYNNQHLDAPLRILPTIKILEHDLEQSTISGAYRPSWFSIVRKYAGVNFALFAVFLVITLGLFAGQSYLEITQSNDPLRDSLGKFLPPALSGMITSLVTLWYTVWDRRRLIDWSFADLRVRK